MKISIYTHYSISLEIFKTLRNGRSPRGGKHWHDSHPSNIKDAIFDNEFSCNQFGNRFPPYPMIDNFFKFLEGCRFSITSSSFFESIEFRFHPHSKVNATRCVLFFKSTSNASREFEIFFRSPIDRLPSRLSSPSCCTPNSLPWPTLKKFMTTFRFFSFPKCGGTFFTLVSISSSRNKLVSKYKFEGNSSKSLQ